MGDFDVNKPEAVMDLWSAISVESGVDRQVCKMFVIKYISKPDIDVIDIMADLKVKSMEASSIIRAFDDMVDVHDYKPYTVSDANAGIYKRVAGRIGITEAKAKYLVESWICGQIPLPELFVEIKMSLYDIRKFVSIVDRIVDES